MSEIVSDIQERLEAGRAEVRRAVASDSVVQIHPFDMFTLLRNPMVIDVVVINLFQRQFDVVDGTVYEMTTSVQNKTKLSDIMVKHE